MSQPAPPACPFCGYPLDRKGHCNNPSCSAHSHDVVDKKGTRNFIIQTLSNIISQGLVDPNLLNMTNEQRLGVITERLAAACKENLPAYSRVEFVQEDADTLLVRQIHEEPDDVIRLNVTLPAAINRIMLTTKIGDSSSTIEIGSDDCESVVPE